MNTSEVVVRDDVKFAAADQLVLVWTAAAARLASSNSSSSSSGGADARARAVDAVLERARRALLLDHPRGSSNTGDDDDTKAKAKAKAKDGLEDVDEAADDAPWGSWWSVFSSPAASRRAVRRRVLWGAPDTPEGRRNRWRAALRALISTADGFGDDDFADGRRRQPHLGPYLDAVASARRDGDVEEARRLSRAAAARAHDETVRRARENRPAGRLRDGLGVREEEPDDDDDRAFDAACRAWLDVELDALADVDQLEAAEAKIAAWRRDQALKRGVPFRPAPEDTVFGLCFSDDDDDDDANISVSRPNGDQKLKEEDPGARGNKDERQQPRQRPRKRQRTLGGRRDGAGLTTHAEENEDANSAAELTRAAVVVDAAAGTEKTKETSSRDDGRAPSPPKPRDDSDYPSLARAPAFSGPDAATKGRSQESPRARFSSEVVQENNEPRADARPETATATETETATETTTKKKKPKKKKRGDEDDAMSKALRERIGRTAYVSKLAAETTEDAVRATFEASVGRVAAAHLVVDKRTGASKCAALVEFADDAGMARALALSLGSSSTGEELAPISPAGAACYVKRSTYAIQPSSHRARDQSKHTRAASRVMGPPVGFVPRVCVRGAGANAPAPRTRPPPQKIQLGDSLRPINTQPASGATAGGPPPSHPPSLPHEAPPLAAATTSSPGQVATSTTAAAASGSLSNDAFRAFLAPRTLARSAPAPPPPKTTSNTETIEK